MEILVLSDKPAWPANSGGSFATRAIINQLIRSGHRVTLLCYHTTKHSYKEELSLPHDSKHLAIVAVKVISSIRITGLIFNFLFSKLPYDIYRYRTRAFRKTLKDILLTGRYEIVQFEGLKVCQHIDLVRKHSDSKLVYRAHNVESTLWNKRARISNKRLTGWYFKNLGQRTLFFERLVYNKIDGLIAISDQDLSEMHLFYGGKSLTVLPIIEEVIESKTGNKGHSNNISILFFGSLDWQPNIHGLEWFLKEVYPLILIRNGDIKLKVAGRGASKKTIRLIKGSGALYCGSPEDSELFLQSSSVLIVPLFAASGIRIKIIEALGQGLDIVTTNEGAAGLPEEIKNIINIEDQAETFAGQVIKLTEKKSADTGDEHRILNLVKGFFGKFTNDNKIDEFYSDIINDT